MFAFLFMVFIIALMVSALFVVLKVLLLGTIWLFTLTSLGCFMRFFWIFIALFIGASCFGFILSAF